MCTPLVEVEGPQQDAKHLVEITHLKILRGIDTKQLRQNCESLVEFSIARSLTPSPADLTKTELLQQKHAKVASPASVRSQHL